MTLLYHTPLDEDQQTALGITPPQPLAMADQVRVPIMTQADRSAQTKLPRTGQSQASVEQAYGTPSAMSGPVGRPPISQWDYATFVVYFEQDRVIHTVLKPNR